MFATKTEIEIKKGRKKERESERVNEGGVHKRWNTNFFSHFNTKKLFFFAFFAFHQVTNFFFCPSLPPVNFKLCGETAEKKLTKWESEWVSESERVTESERKREKIQRMDFDIINEIFFSFFFTFFTLFASPSFFFLLVVLIYFSIIHPFLFTFFFLLSYYL